jgi:hypothetical protein
VLKIEMTPDISSSSLISDMTALKNQQSLKEEQEENKDMDLYTKAKNQYD